MTEIVTSGSMSGQGKRSDGLLGESGHERRRLRQAPPVLHATARVYELGIAARRPYAFWVFGSPVAFLLVLGLPIAWLALRSSAPEARAIASVIAIAAIAGFTKAETERIWLFLAPLVCLAAAPLVQKHRALAAALAVQALVYGALMNTVW